MVCTSNLVKVGVEGRREFLTFEACDEGEAAAVCSALVGHAKKHKTKDLQHVSAGPLVKSLDEKSSWSIASTGSLVLSGPTLPTGSMLSNGSRLYWTYGVCQRSHKEEEELQQLGATAVRAAVWLLSARTLFQQENKPPTRGQTPKEPGRARSDPYKTRKQSSRGSNMFAVHSRGDDLA